MNFKHADKFNRQVVCPYSEVKSCKLAQQKIHSRAITFECVKCKRLMCGNFRYSDDANMSLCWPCGLKMNQHEINRLQPHTDQDDLT